MSRKMRRAFAAATVVGSLFALPAAANANATLSFTGGPTGTAVAGDTVNYTLHIAVTADFAADNTIDISTNYGGATIGTMTVTPNAGANDEEVSVAGTEITLGAALLNAENDVDVVIPVTLPKYYIDSDFQVETEHTSGAATISEPSSSAITVSKGGPSDLRFHTTKLGVTGVDALQNKWVKKGTSAGGEVTVTNAGTGSAHFVNVGVDLNGNNDFYLSPELPNPPFSTFAPELTISAGTCAPTSATTCTIADLAAGATVTIPFTVTKLTHFGWISVEASMDSKADAGDDHDCAWRGNFFEYNAATGGCDPIAALDGFDGYVSITDGTTTEPHVGLVTDTVAAAGNATVTFAGGVSAAGAPIAAGSLLVVESDSYKDNKPTGTSYEGDTGVSQSIQTISIAGGTCTSYVNPSNGKKELDHFVCTLPAIAAGSRLAFTVDAKFATTFKNTSQDVTATLYSPSYMLPAADTGSGATVNLNVDRTSDISVVAKSAALVGAGNVAPVDVVVTNTGNTKARNVWFDATVPGTSGSFGDAEQNAACSLMRANGAGVKTLHCGIGELAAGASRTVTIWVTAGSKLGSLPVSINAGQWSGDGFDTNPDNNWVVQNLTITKKNLVPLLGVKVAKAKAVKKATLLKAGVKTVVTTPVASVVKVDIVVSGKVAKDLGLIKKASKKDVVIGTKKVVTKKGQKVTVTTKLSLKFKTKIAKVKKSFTAKRVVTVTSSDRKSTGATSLTSSNMPIK